MFSLHPKYLHLFLCLVLKLCSDLRGLATYRRSRKKNKMASVMSYAKGLVLLVTVSTLLGVGSANRPIAGGGNGWWKWNPNNTYVGGGGREGGGGPGNNNWGYNNMPNRTTTVNVGGPDNTWTFGFNYIEWAFRNGPFYLNDTLVFKYDPPSNTTGPHSVYLFRDFWSYRSCNLKRAKMIGSVTQGGGEGFKFVLNNWQPYYFACGEHAPIHCKLGKMKFMVMPFPRYRPED